MQIMVVNVKSSDASCTKGATYVFILKAKLFTDLNWSCSSDNQVNLVNSILILPTNVGNIK